MTAMVCATEVLMKLGSGVAAAEEPQARDASIKTVTDIRIGLGLNMILL
jgi:hypothetical protein